MERQQKFTILRFMTDGMDVDHPLWEKLRKADNEELKPLLKRIEDYNNELEEVYYINDYTESEEFISLNKRKETIMDNAKMVLDW